MKKKNLYILLLSAAMSLQAKAGLITNGDFATCDLSGWQTDSFTAGSPGYDTDFSVSDNAGDCSADIHIDYFDTNEFLVNTLYTDIDLSVADGFGLTLSFDWMFSGEEEGWDPFGRDYWSVGLGDGSGLLFGADGQAGSVFQGFDYDNGTVNIDLDPSLFNLSGWTLEFQLFAGFDVNFLGSTLNIDNVQLNQFELPVAQVPEPSPFALIFAGLFGLIYRNYIGKA